MRSTTKTDFPSAKGAVERGDKDQIDKLRRIALGSISDGKRLQRALERADRERKANGMVSEETIAKVNEVLWYMSSAGSTVNSWSEEDRG